MVGSVRDKIISLFKTNTIKNYDKPTYVSNVYGDQKKLRKPKNKKNIKKTK